VHTSTKARLTSVAIRIRIRIQIRIRILADPDRHQNLIKVAHGQPSLKILCKSVWKFLLTYKETNRQTMTIT